MKTCTVSDCHRPHKAQGLCGPHYHRLLRHGDALADVPLRETFATQEERFWAKVYRSGGPDACWPWQATLLSYMLRA
jgi:hypothetical protein